MVGQDAKFHRKNYNNIQKTGSAGYKNPATQEA